MNAPLEALQSKRRAARVRHPDTKRLEALIRALGHGDRSVDTELQQDLLCVRQPKRGELSVWRRALDEYIKRGL